MLPLCETAPHRCLIDVGDAVGTPVRIVTRVRDARGKSRSGVSKEPSRSEPAWMRAPAPRGALALALDDLLAEAAQRRHLFRSLRGSRGFRAAPRPSRLDYRTG